MIMFQTMDGPPMANSVRTSHAKWQVGNSSGNPLDPADPPDPVSGGTARDITSSRAGGQEDGSSHELPQKNACDAVETKESSAN